MSSVSRTIHQMPSGSLHKTWNRSNRPVITVRPGDEITLSAPDAAKHKEKNAAGKHNCIDSVGAT